MEVRHQLGHGALADHPAGTARQAGLKYVTDASRGFSRTRKRNEFHFLNARGQRIRNPNVVNRIKSLAIPPAWTDVWICPTANGHLQATGRDARGRKQYRYHPRWREVRDDTKFARMIQFARALPRVRQQIERDLKRKGLSRAKVLAAIVRLLDLCHIRVGNDEYARTNKSYGLTTIRDHHATVRGSRVTLRFKGKAAREHTIDIEDRQLAKIVNHCQDLPGQELFQWVDESGQVRDVKSDDVNQYLRDISRADFTAKDFRTWAGTVWAARELCGTGKANTRKQMKKAIGQAVVLVAAKLGNTPAICRKCYVHPAIFESYQNGTMVEHMPNRGNGEAKVVPKTKLAPDEKCVLQLLCRHAADQAETLNSKLRRSIARGKGTLTTRRTARTAGFGYG